MLDPTVCPITSLQYYNNLATAPVFLFNSNLSFLSFSLYFKCPVYVYIYVKVAYLLKMMGLRCAFFHATGLVWANYFAFFFFPFFLPTQCVVDYGCMMDKYLFLSHYHVFSLSLTFLSLSPDTFTFCTDVLCISKRTCVTCVT